MLLFSSKLTKDIEGITFFSEHRFTLRKLFVKLNVRDELNMLKYNAEYNLIILPTQLNQKFTLKQLFQQNST